ncbi:hypothetical protein [Novosphingobium sp.]|jgi:hypothetical protein|uniref:hypothetical protein n=1 Tax=Novosphingobium sp. TaxID=1874826 RepID=UPI00286B43A3|nr:hypothetical protein [Novosphingobium sp.]
MNLPKIDISALPDLNTLTAAFGSLFQPGQAGNDDTVIIMMVFVYERLIQP